MNIDQMIQVRQSAETRMNDVKVRPADRKRARVSYNMAVAAIRRIAPKLTESEIDPDGQKFQKA